MCKGVNEVLEQKLKSIKQEISVIKDSINIINKKIDKLLQYNSNQSFGLFH